MVFCSKGFCKINKNSKYMSFSAFCLCKNNWSLTPLCFLKPDCSEFILSLSSAHLNSLSAIRDSSSLPTDGKAYWSKITNVNAVFFLF